MMKDWKRRRGKRRKRQVLVGVQTTFPWETAPEAHKRRALTVLKMTMGSLPCESSPTMDVDE